jgi:hydroxymethylpyrimidine pyrophosphatase-like HAD family hydrolase
VLESEDVSVLAGGGVEVAAGKADEDRVLVACEVAARDTTGDGVGEVWRRWRHAALP